MHAVATKTNSRLGFVLKILVAAALLFFVMNMFMPSCGAQFGCGSQSWPPQANADSRNCPKALSGAATDKKWAADRIATITSEKPTVLLAYDEDGTEHRFTSGEDSDQEKVAKKLGELGFSSDRSGRYPAASHAEAKRAYWMRETGVKHVVAVINNKKGVCQDGDQTCDALTNALLPRGYLIEVWSPGQAKPTQLPGGA
ncbi:MAG: hypothetical protein M3443_04530 [Actinomycetota bacterium]|nr:hypothetical protein [Actinomycetota bacterium]